MQSLMHIAVDLGGSLIYKQSYQKLQPEPKHPSHKIETPFALGCQRYLEAKAQTETHWYTDTKFVIDVKSQPI